MCSELRGRCAADAALTWRIAAAPEVAAALAHAVADAAARRDGALRAEVSSLAAALAAASEPLRDALSADLARRAAAVPYGDGAMGGLLAALAPLLALQPRNAPLGSEPDAVVAACAAALRSPRFGISYEMLLAATSDARNSTHREDAASHAASLLAAAAESDAHALPVPPLLPALLAAVARFPRCVPLQRSAFCACISPRFAVCSLAGSV